MRLEKILFSSELFWRSFGDSLATVWRSAEAALCQEGCIGGACKQDDAALRSDGRQQTRGRAVRAGSLAARRALRGMRHHCFPVLKPAAGGEGQTRGCAAEGCVLAAAVPRDSGPGRRAARVSATRRRGGCIPGGPERGVLAGMQAHGGRRAWCTEGDGQAYGKLLFHARRHLFRR